MNIIQPQCLKGFHSQENKLSIDTQKRLLREQKFKVTDYYTNLIYVQDKAPGYVTLLKDELGITYGDVMGFFTSWTEYKCDNEHRVCYPNAHVGEFNPFSKWVSIRKAAARTMRNLERFEQLNLLWDMTFTYPSEISSLTLTPETIGRCNSCFERIKDYINSEICPTGKFAWSMNTHIWKSEEPLKPHVHHHALMLDVYQKESGDLGKVRTSTFMKYNKRTKRSEPSVFSELIKSKWAEIVNAEFDLNYPKLDVHFEYRDIKKEPEKVVHKLKYNKRTPLPDLANWYLNHNYEPGYDKVYMTELLLYRNKTHNYGYWNRISKLLCTLGNVEIEKGVHRCPICAAKCKVVRTWNESDIPDSYLSVYIDRKGRKFFTGRDDIP